MGVEGAKRLKDRLRKLQNRYQKPSTVSVVVGYSKAYALPVHENVEEKWKGKPRPKNRGHYWDPPGRGQSKFLEQPFREELGKIEAEIIRSFKIVPDTKLALFAGGLLLQAMSQKLVPVDFGFLKGSAFTEIE